MKTIILLSAVLLCTFNSFSQRTSILLDYDAVDEIAATDSGGDYLREPWGLNANFPDDPSVQALTWAVVKFDTLVDADSSVAYTYNDKAIRIDSIRLFFMHQNLSGTPDTLVISVYQYEGATGLTVDSQEQVANAVLFDTVIITTGLSDSFQIDNLTVYPGLQLAEGEKFLVGVHFYGDLSNTFNLLSGYADHCSAACFAAPSVFPSNSNYRVIYWDIIRFTGVNGVLYDCDGDNNHGEAGDCELFTIQNLIIQAYVSFEDTITSFAGLDEKQLIKVYPNPADEFVVVEFNKQDTAAELSLYNSQGRKLFSTTSTSGQKIDLKTLPSGLYFIVLKGSHQNIVVKLMKD